MRYTPECLHFCKSAVRSSRNKAEFGKRKRQLKPNARGKKTNNAKRASERVSKASGTAYPVVTGKLLRGTRKSSSNTKSAMNRNAIRCGSSN